MTFEQKLKCHQIIHAASALSGVVGVIPIVTFFDSVVITPAQVTMVIALGKVFGKEISESYAQAIAGAGVAEMVGKGASKVASKVVFHSIPVIGNIANGAVAASLTEALGWFIVSQFDDDNTVHFQ